MKQFDVCRNLLPGEAARAPYLVILQSDFLDETDVRVAAPLVKLALIDTVRRLNPIFEIEGHKFALSLLDIVGAPKQSIGKKVADLQSERDKIIAAIDMLFTGF